MSPNQKDPTLLYNANMSPNQTDETLTDLYSPCMYIPYLFDQMPRTFFFLLLVFVQLLFEGGIQVFGKPTDVNDGWIRYIQAIQQQLLDIVSSTCSLSVPLSAMVISRTTPTALALVWYSHQKSFSYVWVCYSCD